MARYRGIPRAAVALVLLLTAAWRADAQDMLVIDSGGARWKSGESRKPSVTVDFGVIDNLSADRRRSALRRQDRRARRYLTLSVPQPEPPALPERYDPPAPPMAEARPEPPAAPVPDPASETQPPVPPDSTELAAVPAEALHPETQTPPRPERVAPLPEAQPPALPDTPELAAAPAADLQPEAPTLPSPERVAPPPEAQPPALPDTPELAAVSAGDLEPEAQTPPSARRADPPVAPAADLQPETAAGPSTPPLSKPAAPAPAASAEPARVAALPVRRTPAGKTEATPTLQAFLNRANETNGAARPEQPLRAKLPTPRPIQPRRTESGAAMSAGFEMRFRLPPPAPATDAPRSATASPAPAGGLPPPPPATGASGAGVLPPPAESGAGAPETRRRALVLDAPGLAAIAAPVGTGMPSETFFYEAGGTVLGAEDRARLGSLAARLVRSSGTGVEIRAYSGSAERDGVEARREALSRAMEVRRLLIAAGVPEARIVARAAGAGGEAGARVDVVPVGRS